MEDITWGNNFEPTRENRFIVEFPKEFNIESYLVTKISEIYFEVDGWKDIEIDFMDIIVDGKSVTAPKLFKIVDLIKKQNVITDAIILKKLDPTGAEIEKWKINLTRIRSVDFGGNSYSSDAVSNLKLTISPSECTLV